MHPHSLARPLPRARRLQLQLTYSHRRDPSSIEPQLDLIAMPATDDSTAYMTGSVEWFDAERGVGLISPDDGAPPCAVRAGTLRDCGIASLETGDRVRFRAQDEGGERTATDLTLLPAMQRWENEGGALRPVD